MMLAGYYLLAKCKITLSNMDLQEINREIAHNRLLIKEIISVANYC